MAPMIHKLTLLKFLLASLLYLWSTQSFAQKNTALLDRIDVLERVQIQSEALGDEIFKTLEANRVLSGMQITRLSRIIEEYRSHLVPLIEEAKLTPLPALAQPIPESSLYALLLHGTITRHALSLLNTYFQQPVMRRIVKDLLRSHPTQERLMANTYEYARNVLGREKLNRLKLSLMNVKAQNTEQFSPNALELYQALDLDYLIVLLHEGGKIPGRMTNWGDGALRGFGTIVEYGSWIVGNAAGAIKFRRGHLKSDDGFIDEFAAKLRPFDILLEKTPFILTDSLIPGHYGHAAMYLGTQEQLEELKLWDHPILDEYREQILEGKVIIEAVRSGVRLSNLEEFLNVDEVAIVRMRSIPHPFRVLRTAIEQLNKEYDYGFDLRNPRSIVCSELIYLAHGQVAWPTEETFGRVTITPDHLGELLFYNNTPLEFVGKWIGTSKEIREVGVDTMAQALSFTPLTSGPHSFARQVPVCTKRTIHGIRSGSRRNSRIEFTQCEIRLVPQTYVQ
jgi:hypothetical protein